MRRRLSKRLVGRHWDYPAIDPGEMPEADFIKEVLYDGDDVVLGASPDIATVNDQWTPDNDATQSSAALRPHQETNVLNGHDVIDLAGPSTPQYLNITTGVTDDFLVVAMMFKFDSADITQGLFGMTVIGGYYLRWNGPEGKFEWAVNSVVSSLALAQGLPGSNWHLLIAWYSNTDAEAHFLCDNYYSGPIAGTNMNPVFTYIGLDNDTDTEYFGGQIAEAFMIKGNRKPTLREARGLDRFIRAKYKLIR